LNLFVVSRIFKILRILNTSDKSHMSSHTLTNRAEENYLLCNKTDGLLLKNSIVWRYL